MATFFSGTDINTLKEEGRDRNHFVSLIVNNEGTYTAAVTRKVKAIKTIQESYSYGSFEDTTITGANNYQEEVEFIEYFGLDITKEGETFSFQELDNRLTEIRKRKSSMASIAKPINVPYHKPVEKEPSYPTLFTKDELDDEPKNKIISISEADVQHVLLQLITGSIIIRDTSKIDVKKWASNMPQVFGDRFGKDKMGMNNFEQWAGAHCEFLIYDKSPIGLTAEEESNWVTNFAISLYQELDILPENEYIKTFKEILEQWMIS